MADKVEIYLQNDSGEGWTKSTGWTSMTLSRDKNSLTGRLSVNYFFGYVPQAPVLVDLARGREILVYIQGILAFVGLIDTRRGTGSNGESGRSVSVGPNEYTVTLDARGKTKRLVDSSHTLRANMNNSNSKEVLEKLIEPWGVELDWQAEAQPLNKARFRDGARVIDEIARVALENCHYIFEGRNGDLRVLDGSGTQRGDNLILGQNILSFSAEQSETQAVSNIRVKGQRAESEAWGETAVLPMVREFTSDELAGGTCPIIVQHYGNATDKALERRGMYEGNKRMQQSKQVTVDVFSVDSFTGVPWDIAQIHRVVIPCEGIDTDMECIELTYTCSENQLKTTLRLAPLPTSASLTSGGLLPALSAENLEAASPSISSVTVVGGYPSPWTAGSWTVAQIPVIRTIAQALGNITNSIFNPLSGLRGEDGRPPERLP